MSSDVYISAKATNKQFTEADMVVSWVAGIVPCIPSIFLACNTPPPFHVHGGGGGDTMQIQNW